MNKVTSPAEPTRSVSQMSDSGARKYFGKYRGTVVNNLDPEQRGRLMAQVPDVTGFVPSTWALPCVPMAGLQMGAYVVPSLGAKVWIEFEQGDPDYPIWTGCFWGSFAEVPLSAHGWPPPSPNMVLQTGNQNSITIQGMPGGGIVLSCGPFPNPASPKIMLSPAGITLSSGQGAVIQMTGPMVDINGGALNIT